MDNREKATLIWLAIVLAVGLCARDIRGSLWNVVRAFARPKLVGPMLAFAGWTVGLAALAHVVGLWKADVRNDTVAWFATAGVVLLFSFTKAAEAGFFRRTARGAVAVAVFIEVFVNLKVLGLAAELVLLPVLALVGALLALIESREEFAPARGFLNGLLAAVGGGLLLYVLTRLAADFDAGHTLRALALPIWLAIGSLPFVYVLGLVSEYEQAFLRIDFHTDDPANRRRAKLALLRAAGVRASRVARFTGHWIYDLASAESAVNARAVVQRWRAHVVCKRPGRGPIAA